MEMGILFDFNGVLVNDEHIHEQAFAKTLAQYDIVLTPVLYQELCFGKTDKEGFVELQSRFHKELALHPLEELLTEKQRQYLALLKSENILYPGVKKVIAGLADVAKLGVVTSAMSSELQSILGTNNLTGFFKIFVSAEDVTHGKPHPEAYLKGVEKLKLPSACIAAIEDSPRGVRAARAAGISCIAVLHTTPSEFLTEASRIVDNIEQVTPALIREVLRA